MKPTPTSTWNSCMSCILLLANQNICRNSTGQDVLQNPCLALCHVLGCLKWAMRVGSGWPTSGVGWGYQTYKKKWVRYGLDFQLIDTHDQPDLLATKRGNIFLDGFSHRSIKYTSIKYTALMTKHEYGQGIRIQYDMDMQTRYFSKK